MHYNEHDIDRALEILTERAPDIAPFAKYLSDWKDVINANSDGWAYWSAGTRPADGLARQVDRAVQSIIRLTDDMPTRKELLKTLTPIKSAATRLKLPAPTLVEAPAPGLKR